MSTPLSLGKFRGLQQCATPGGGIAIMALDHRNNLRNAMAPDDPKSVSSEMLMAFKQKVVAALAPVSSAVLLDPEFGAPQVLGAGALPGSTGLICAVEETGYTGDPAARRSELLPNWGPAKVKRLGASAVKLLVYYHPQSETAGYIEDLVRQVAEQCAEQEIPLFVEPLSYAYQPGQKKLSPEERQFVVLETARRLTPLGVDVLKAEFPVDVSAVQDEAAWKAACAELSQASRCPWVLLSASVAYETFVRMLTVACQAGASGVAVGRAVWQEAPTLRGAALQDFLLTVARPRMQRLTALVEALARPWTDFYAFPQVGERWFEGY